MNLYSSIGCTQWQIIKKQYEDVKTNNSKPVCSDILADLFGKPAIQDKVLTTILYHIIFCNINFMGNSQAKDSKMKSLNTKSSAFRIISLTDRHSRFSFLVAGRITIHPCRTYLQYEVNRWSATVLVKKIILLIPNKSFILF